VSIIWREPAALADAVSLSLTASVKSMNCHHHRRRRRQQSFQ